MLVKDSQHIAKVADVHGNRIESRTGSAGHRTQAGLGFDICGLIGGDTGNAACEEIADDRLADEAQATRYQELRAFAHGVARLVISRCQRWFITDERKINYDRVTEQ